MQNQKGNGSLPIPTDPQHITPEQIQNLLKQLSPADQQRVNAVLKNQEATRKLLSTPQAKALLKKFGGGK